MGTCNYARGNLKTVYSVLEDVDQDIYEMEFDFLKQDLLHMMEAKFSQSKNITVYQDDGSDGRRNFPGEYLVSVSREYPLGTLEIKCKASSGYYYGCNLEVDYFFEGSEYESIDDIILDYGYYEEKSFRKPEKTMRKDFERMVRGIEQVYTKISQPLEVLGVFSNGEAVYKSK